MFQENISLAKYSNYQIGGPARFFYKAKTINDVQKAVAEANKRGLRIFVLGGGTNVVFSDNGFDGLVLKLEFDVIKQEGSAIRAGAGALMSNVVDFAAKEGLSGLEWAGGLPGTLGGAIRGNAGAFGGEIKDSVVEVTSLNIEDHSFRVVVRSNSECKFEYRSSIFKKENNLDTREIILEAILQLKNGDREEIKEAVQEKIDYRNKRHPMEYPNVGSIFKNVPLERIPLQFRERFSEKVKADPFPVLPTAVLIAAAGLTGTKVGGAMISNKHPNFIVNAGGAKAADVRKLADLIKTRVKERFDIELEEEVLFL